MESRPVAASTDYVQIRTSDGPMNAVWRTPKAIPKGAVIVFHEAFGLTDHIVDICERLSSEGWAAISPALLHRQGSPVFDYDDLSSARAMMDNLTPQSLRMDILATMGYLETKGYDDQHIAAIGFCIGGTIAFYANTLRSIGAAITFYGGGITKGRIGLPCLIELAESLKSPWLGLYGDLDESIPIDEVEALRAALKQSHQPTNLVRYENAGHGFHCDARPNHFEPNSAKDAWRKTMNWLGTHVKEFGTGKG